MIGPRGWRWPAYLAVALLSLGLLAWWIRDVPTEPDGDPDGGAIGVVVFFALAVMLLGVLAVVVFVLEQTVFRAAPALLPVGARRSLVAGGVVAVVLALSGGSGMAVPVTWFTILLAFLPGVVLMLLARARVNAVAWIAGLICGTSVGWYLAVLESVAAGDWPS